MHSPREDLLDQITSGDPNNYLIRTSLEELENGHIHAAISDCMDAFHLKTHVEGEQSSYLSFRDPPLQNTVLVFLPTNPVHRPQDDRLVSTVTAIERRTFDMRSGEGMRELLSYLLALQFQFPSLAGTLHEPLERKDDLLEQLRSGNLGNALLQQGLVEVAMKRVLNAVVSFGMAFKLGLNFVDKECTTVIFTERDLRSLTIHRFDAIFGYKDPNGDCYNSRPTSTAIVLRGLRRSEDNARLKALRRDDATLERFRGVAGVILDHRFHEDDVILDLQGERVIISLINVLLNHRDKFRKVKPTMPSSRRQNRIHKHPLKQKSHNARQRISIQAQINNAEKLSKKHAPI